MLDFEPLERTKGCKFKLLPVHVLALAELPVFMNNKGKITLTDYDLATVIFS